MMHKANPVVALIIAALALWTIGCAGIGPGTPADDATSTPPPRLLGGTITIVAGEPGPADEIADTFHNDAAHSWYHVCHGAGRYDNLREGGTVIVRNGSGDTLGFDRLDNGYYRVYDADGQQLNFWKIESEPFDEHGDYRYYGQCVLDFSVEIPAEPADRYVVEVPNHGELTYAHKELEDLYWHIELTLE
jgi:hypothetical protein